MREKILQICNRTIEYTLYALFLTVPLAFTSTTSELFEFNKMWLTFGYVIIIAASWICKMILQRRIFIQKTPLDIPIALFLLSQIIATLFSIDQHLSIWGYYSRFNGGLLSIFSYIFLYYALLSNVTINASTLVKRLIIISITSGTIVALWGLPSHFGYDPTCLMFRGTLDVSCWTAEFMPKIRIFSTLGQPNWLAAYLSILLPLSLALTLQALDKLKKEKNKRNIITASLFFLISLLFYFDIIYTDSQSGFVATTMGIGVFCVGYFFLARKTIQPKIVLKRITILLAAILVIAFVIGIPVVQLKQFTFAHLQQKLAATKAAPAPSTPKQAGSALEGGGGTDSGTIRKYVWQGALDAWKANPLFGTGVETYAFTYYRYRPQGHNVTSEWDFLYNKAHNEYLNYLATTGAFGLLSYLLMIGVFLWFSIKHIFSKHTEEQIWKTTALALVAGYISILIVNFFGFSVVIVNIYLFLIPALVFLLANTLTPHASLFKKAKTPVESLPKQHASSVTGGQWAGIIIVIVIACFELILLTRFWLADQAFALAQNLNRVGEYEQGSTQIRQAVSLRDDEPVFKEELATSDATIAVILASQKQDKAAGQLATEAVQTINQLVTQYPNNLNFLKSKVRIYYTLSQINPEALQTALKAMEQAQTLAPTDAKIAYNLGVLYGQTGQTQKGITILQKTIQLKPNYYEAYYALGLFYRDLAVDKNGKVVNSEMQQKAVETMQYLVDNVKYKLAEDALKNWQ